MTIRILLLATLFVPAFVASARAEFDPQEAFKAHRKFMVGGTWVTTSEEGKVQVDRHVASKSKKFVRIVNVLGGTAFTGIYGIDPESGDLTLWVFEDDADGSILKWKCTAYENGKWTWVSEHKDRPTSGTAVLTRINEDEMRLKFTGEASPEQVWKRER